MSELRAAAAEERAAALRVELEAVRRLLAGLPDPPEPLTSGELAARALAPVARNPIRQIPTRQIPTRQIPAPPADSAPGTIAAARSRLAAGRISPVDLVEEALERARASADLGTFLLLREEEALAEARRATESFAAVGRGEAGARPLLGIPLSVKDIVDVAGLTTTSGSKFPHEATRSAPAWQALADAGAILLGKNNLQEFAFGVSGDNPTFGRTRNPHDPGRILGGSSSGSAVAVAAGVGYGSVGSDTGGSIRIPAGLTGVFGLKPSYGVVSRAGVTPLSWSLDHVGPIARSAGDIAALFEALAGVPAVPPPSGGRGDSQPLAGLRVGVPLDFFYTDLSRDARRAAEAVVTDLVGLGAERIKVRIPEVELGGCVPQRARIHGRPRRCIGNGSPRGRTVSARTCASSWNSAACCPPATSSRRYGAGDSSPTPSPGCSTPWTSWRFRPHPRGLRKRGTRCWPPGRDPSRTHPTGRPFQLHGPARASGSGGFDALGMPLGAQLVAGPGQDVTAIRVAGWLETSGPSGRARRRRERLSDAKLGSKVLLENKRGLIVGVANHRSFAWGIARSTAREGAELALSFQNERLQRNVDKLAAGLPGTITLPLDVSSEEQLESAVETVRERFGGLDFLVHAVAYALREDLEGDFVSTSREGFRVAHDVSVYSLTALVRHFAPLLEADGGGSAVTLSYLGGERAVPHYNVMGWPRRRSSPRSVTWPATWVHAAFG